MMTGNEVITITIEDGDKRLSTNYNIMDANEILETRSEYHLLMLSNLLKKFNDSNMTKTITIDGEDYEVNVEAAIKAGLLKKAVTHTTGDFYKDDTGVIYMLTIWEHVAYLIIVKGIINKIPYHDNGIVYNYTKCDGIMSDFDFNKLATKKLTKIECPIK